MTTFDPPDMSAGRPPSAADLLALSLTIDVLGATLHKICTAADLDIAITTCTHPGPDESRWVIILAAHDSSPDQEREALVFTGPTLMKVLRDALKHLNHNTGRTR